ncbi:hypothetical protein BH753_gp172 [Bacillus phage Shbh1]|uniref:Uncharacterized protein n=1 Tax=Bacillus phage Shbh1 TaxID=1796992 RepID=A0A142F1J7_9CAUD|nr:hypothetical protein BH753_gp172 [Bacillus phage Shbh1]AMQ66654.1 hypothetical protein [Bacillus phage Shbh1]
MSTLAVLALTLYSVVGITLVLNMVQLIKEVKNIKKQGKTPLVKQNILTVIVAALGEVLAVYLCLLVTETILATFTTGTVIAVFAITYFVRSVFAYLSAWGLWSIFLKWEKHKKKNEIEKDIEERQETQK